MKIIVGLGNPGDKYKSTRHNVGFMVLDQLADELHLQWETSKKFKAEIAKSSDLILMKPLTFMNLSGEAVASTLAYYKLADDDLTEILTVIHDDLDVDLGKYKLATDSRAAGHNGVQSIIDRLGTKKFSRYRVGIRTPLREQLPADKFVLQKFNDEELGIIMAQSKDIAKQLA